MCVCVRVSDVQLVSHWNMNRWLCVSCLASLRAIHVSISTHHLTHTHTHCALPTHCHDPSPIAVVLDTEGISLLAPNSNGLELAYTRLDVRGKKLTVRVILVCLCVPVCASDYVLLFVQCPCVMLDRHAGCDAISCSIGVDLCVWVKRSHATSHLMCACLHGNGQCVYSHS